MSDEETRDATILPTEDLNEKENKPLASLCSSDRKTVTLSDYESLLKEYPFFDVALNDKIKEKLSTNHDEPYHSNTDYLDVMVSYFNLKRLYMKLCETVEEMHVIPKEKNITSDDVNSPKEMANRIIAFKKLIAYTKNLMDQRLMAHEQHPDIALPRFVRLAQKTDMTSKELVGIVYITCVFLEFFSYDFTSVAYRGTQAARLSIFSEMDYAEQCIFFQTGRPYIKEKIIITDEDDPLSNRVTIPFASACVLTGSELSTDDMLKLDKTILSEIILEEKGEPILSKSTDALFNNHLSEDDENNEDAKSGDEQEDENEDIFDFLRKQVEAESKEPKDESAVVVAEGDLKPYTDNIDYFNDQIEWLNNRIKLLDLQKDIEQDNYRVDNKSPAKLRELKAHERMLKAKCSKRLQLTKENGKWLPRVELLVNKLKLDEFEKCVLICLAGTSLCSSTIKNDSRVDSWSIFQLLRLFCSSFAEEVQCRRYFYKSGKLVKEGIIRLSDNWGSELMNVDVEIDRRMLDFVVELDSEINEMVEGSHLYFPTVKLDQVVLPEDQKKLIVDTVSNFEHFSKARKRLGFDETISYGSGMLILFYGKSGTGKTMLANAIGNHLKKRILLINYPSLGEGTQDQVIKYIFREAKLTDSILFFDECESIFMSRDYISGSVNMLLTEIERHNGMIIMATNRSYDLDEAMHRRITLAIEFRTPDPDLRQEIWKSHFPSTENLKLEESIDWKFLALKYELTGGFIKNAILSALSAAVSRDPNNIIITQKDLEKGAHHQLRGRLSMIEFDRRVVPKRGLDDVIVATEVRRQLEDVIAFEKARGVLFSAWGYDEKMCGDQGIACLFYGPPGTGKSLAAEAIGLETGKPLMVVNVAQLISEYVGRTGKNIETVFKEAKDRDAIIVFDECEALFGARSQDQSSSGRGANMDVGLLLYHLEKFSGIAVLITNLVGNIDNAFFRRIKFLIEFPIPTAALRQKLWQVSLPPAAPKSSDIDFAKIGVRYEFSGGHIKNCCFKASARAALRFGAERIVTMKDLERAAEEELAAINGTQGGNLNRTAQMFS